MAETVRNGTRHVGDANLQTLDEGLNGVVKEAIWFTSEDLKYWVINLGLPCLSADEHPDLVRHLVGQFVKAKGRCQADDTSRNPLGGLGETVVLCPCPINQHVQAAPRPCQSPLPVKVR